MSSWFLSPPILTHYFTPQGAQGEILLRTTNSHGLSLAVCWWLPLLSWAVRNHSPLATFHHAFPNLEDSSFAAPCASPLPAFFRRTLQQQASPSRWMSNSQGGIEIQQRPKQLPLFVLAVRFSEVVMSCAHKPVFSNSFPENCTLTRQATVLAPVRGHAAHKVHNCFYGLQGRQGRSQESDG